MNYWLLKTEPTDYSIDDLARDKKIAWTGVRNYQARNFMRDLMKLGDQVLFYHSSTEVPAIVGLAEVSSEPYGDETAFDPSDSHFDPKSNPDNPTWILVDISFVEKFKNSLSLETIKSLPQFEGMRLIQRGSRLSVQPVEEKHFKEVMNLIQAK